MARVECVKILHECRGNPDLHVQQLWKPKHVKFYSDDGRILSQLTSEEEEAPFFLELFGWTVKVALIDNYILTTDPNTSMPQDMAHQIQVSAVHRLCCKNPDKARRLARDPRKFSFEVHREERSPPTSISEAAQQDRATSSPLKLAA